MSLVYMSFVCPWLPCTIIRKKTLRKQLCCSMIDTSIGSNPAAFQSKKEKYSEMYSVGNDLWQYFPSSIIRLFRRFKKKEKKEKKEDLRSAGAIGAFEWSIIWRAPVTAPLIVYSRHPSQHWLLCIQHFIWRGVEATCYRNWRWTKRKMEHKRHASGSHIKKKLIAIDNEEWQEICNTM